MKLCIRDVPDSVLYPDTVLPDPVLSGVFCFIRYPAG